MNLKQQILDSNNKTSNEAKEKNKKETKILNKGSSSNINMNKENELLNMTNNKEKILEEKNTEKSIVIPTQIPIISKSIYPFYFLKIFIF